MTCFSCTGNRNGRKDWYVLLKKKKITYLQFMGKNCNWQTRRISQFQFLYLILYLIITNTFRLKHHKRKLFANTKNRHFISTIFHPTIYHQTRNTKQSKTDHHRLEDRTEAKSKSQTPLHKKRFARKRGRFKHRKEC